VPFDDYDGMTQQQYQDSVSPFVANGSNMPISVPKGWRRVETGRPGKILYVHMATGAISRYPKEQFDCNQSCWISKDGKTLDQDVIDMHPEKRALQLVREQVAQQAALKPPKEQAKEEENRPAQILPMEEQTTSSALMTMDDLEPSTTASSLPVALLFPGQGSQTVGMLKLAQEIPAVQKMLQTARDVLGYDIMDVCLQGPAEKLEETRYCQPAMYIAGLAAVEKLRLEKPDRVDRCRALAGLSLGEYTALTVAGVFDFATGLKIVKLRGEVMQKAAQASPQAMVSIAGLDLDTVQKLCRDSCEKPEDVCQVANFLFPNGFSCAGSAKAVERLQNMAQNTKGVLQAKMLMTSGAFHTPMMKAAQSQLIAALKEVEGSMSKPRCDVYMNVTGKRITPEASPSEITAMLGDQLIGCVQWEPSMRGMLEAGITEFYECGPNKQLKAMMKRIDKKASDSTTNVDV